MNRVKRVGCSNNRETKGRIYHLNADGKILDDRSNHLSPTDNSDYWIKLDDEKTEDTTMSDSIRVRTVIQINERDAAGFNDGELINLIVKEEAAINQLGFIAATSIAIGKQIKQHKNNIKDLVSILDGRSS